MRTCSGKVTSAPASKVVKKTTAKKPIKKARSSKTAKASLTKLLKPPTPPKSIRTTHSKKSIAATTSKKVKTVTVERYTTPYPLKDTLVSQSPKITKISKTHIANRLRADERWDKIDVISELDRSKLQYVVKKGESI